MKLYSLSIAPDSRKPIAPKEISEMIIHATPNELRLISDFLLAEATRMEQINGEYSHGHLSSYDPALASEQNIIVSLPYVKN